MRGDMVSFTEPLGYQVVIVPSDTQRAAIKAMQRVLTVIASIPRVTSLAPKHMARKL